MVLCLPYNTDPHHGDLGTCPAPLPSGKLLDGRGSHLNRLSSFARSDPFPLVSCMQHPRTKDPGLHAPCLTGSAAITFQSVSSCSVSFRRGKHHRSLSSSSDLSFAYVLIMVDIGQPGP